LPAARLVGRPSVIVFLTDTLRADRLGAYGYAGPTSPAFDAFARESIVFEDAWAHAPWTRPTVASIFTGLHPSTHGAGGFNNSLGEGFATMAELFKQGGYRTGAVVANHVVGSRFGFAQGFDVWNDGEKKLYGFSAREAVERALHFVDAGPQPFFLYVHTLEPHVPYEPSDESWEPFRLPGAVRTPSLPLLMKKKTPRSLDYLHTLYLGEIRDNDQAFGKLIEGLRARGRLADTLVSFVADHGEEFGDHGGHGHTLYREVIRIPLAVRLPGGARGGFREKKVVSQIDLLPTLLSLSGLAAPQVHEGRDLSALWLGRSVPDEPELVSETRFGKAEKSALRVGSLKLIVNEDTRTYGDLGGPVELYDLAADPAEKHDLAGSDPIAVQYLTNRLFELRSAQRRAAKTLRGGAKVELSEEDKEQLRALGYVE
jgi:arylsulfatase A-like enzyme